MELFLKFVFVAVMIYYAGLLFFKYAMPWLLARFIRKQQEKYFQQPPFSKTENPDPKSNKKTPGKKKKPNDQGDTFGEYIDYEEIKDE